MEKSTTKGYLFIAMAAILFGFQGVLSRYVLNYNISAMTLAFLKTSIGAVVLLALMLVFRVRTFRIAPSDIMAFILYGVLGVGLFSYFFFVAIERTNVMTAVTLMYTSGAFTILLAAYFLKEKITKNKLISVAVTFVGTLLVVVGYNLDQLVFDPLGLLAGIAVGATYGFYNVNSKKFVKKYNTWIANFYSVAIAAVFLSVFVNPIEIFTGEIIPGSAWKFIFLLSFLTYGVAYTLFIQGFKTVEAGRGGIVANIEPVVSVVLARIFFQENMGILQAIGFVLIFLAIFITTRKESVSNSIMKEKVI